MIKKLLIANRAEIAIRIARTATDMGIDTVAVYTQDDEQSLHITHADDSALLTGQGVKGYLDQQDIISIAQKMGCDAIHPGYGLLSESADFVKKCEDHAIIFVGPTSHTIEATGDKAKARQLALSAGVSVIPGKTDIDSDEDVETFFEANKKAPLMLKAINGGGGRGMRIITQTQDIAPAFQQCTAEAQTAFGNSSLYAERFLPNVRHIEVQIIGDGKSYTHLFERDCSIQRRHQKVIEIAPAPNLEDQIREKLHQAAIRIAEACHYKGLGTVEFLVDTETGDFFFIELNPRIQVEHTITEAITNLDLVAHQLEIAAGKSLADLNITQEKIAPPQGLSIQLRINAETVSTAGEAGDFVPASGKIDQFYPASGPGVRVDTHAYPGYSPNPFFDNMLAKLIVYTAGSDFKDLCRKADRSLSEFQIIGVDTNIDFLRRFISMDQFQSWDLTVQQAEAGIKDIIKDIVSKSDREPGPGLNRTPPNQQHSSSPDQGSNDPTIIVPENGHILTSPVQAQLMEISVAPGDTFKAGDCLAVVEAMKMQHILKAETAGTVHTVIASPKDIIKAGGAILTYIASDEQSLEQHNQENIDPDFIRDDLQDLYDRQAFTLDENRPEACEKRWTKGQKTIRENLARLTDGAPFSEYGQLVYAAQRSKFDQETLQKKTPADGIIVGIANVNQDQSAEGKSKIAFLGYDATVIAGTQGMHGHHKTDRMLEIAREQDLPIIFFTEGGGGRPNDVDFEVINRCALNLTTFHHFAGHQSYAPNITISNGYCFAGNAALFGAGDVRIATEQSWIGLGGPAMIKAGGLGDVAPKEIGPATEQATNGLIDCLVKDEFEAVDTAKKILSYFQGPSVEYSEADQRLLRHVVPENRKQVYDMRDVIPLIADVDSFTELKPLYNPGMITGLIRIRGNSLGVMANNPIYLGGALDAGASQKAADFLRLCNKFNLPVLSLCDTPGFMVGPDSERNGGVMQASNLLAAGAALQTPLVFLCTRKGYGIGAQAMAGGGFTIPVTTLSWPSGEFGPMGLEGSVELGFAKELSAASTPQEREQLFNSLLARVYEEGKAVNIASLVEIDAVIDPLETRAWIVNSLF